MMSTDVQAAMFTAQEARRSAESAADLAKSVAQHLGTISGSLEALRSENTAQHKENGKIVTDGLERVHARISTVKETMDTNIRSITTQLGDLEKNVITKAAALTLGIDQARSAAKDGDHEVKNEVKSKAFGFLWKFVVFLLVIIAGLIGYASHGTLNFGG